MAMRMFWFWVILGLGGCAVTPPPVKLPATTPSRPAISLSGPPATPFLRLETGGHTAMIKRIGVDAAGRYLVTGSEDKTARVWNLADGGLLQTLRPPLGEGNEGKVYAVAIAPEGGTVAVAGWTGWDWEGKASIYLFDRATGQLVRRLDGLPNVILDLAYSRDGRYLAAALWGANGIRVYRANDWQEAARDTEYGADSYSVDFDRAGRLVTTSYDGFIRLYDSAFRRIAQQQAPGGKQPYSAHFSPDGQTIAVGFNDSTAVNLLSGRDLSLLYIPDTRSVDNRSLNAVAWSEDGHRLYAGGRYDDGSGWKPLLRWNDAGHGAAERFRVSTNTLMDLRPLADGRLAFGAQDPVFGVLDRDGGKRWEHWGDILDFRGDNEGHLLLSHNGSMVEFGFYTMRPDGGWLGHTAHFDFSQRQLVPGPGNSAVLVAPNTDGEPKINWRNTEHPKVLGQALPLEPYEASRRLALASKSPGFLLGTEWRLRYYDRPDRQRWQTPIPGTAWAVNLSADGRYAVAAFGDGTLRWYTTTAGREILALYVHPDGQRWIAWTPEGFYDAAPGAEDLIGYHLNQGKDRAGQFVAARQLQERYYRPSLIARRLSPDGDRLLAEAVRELGDVREVLAQGLPPKLELLSPAEARTGGEYRLELRLRDQGGGIGPLKIRIDGSEIEGRPADIPGGGDTVSRLFTLAPGRHEFEIAARNRQGVESAPTRVVVTSTAPETRPALHLLAVGVSQYRDHTLTEGVRFAAQDAEAVRGRFQAQAADLYRDTPDIRYLRDGDATRANIEREMRGFAERVGPEDVFVLYLAGHGAGFEQNYHFIPAEARYLNQTALRSASLDETLLQKLLAGISAKKTLVLLDTCSAGSFGEPRGRALGDKFAIDRFSRITGRAIIAATADGQMALEGEGGHGAFTYVLLNGLQGLADGNRDGRIDLYELGQYIGEQLPALTLRKWKYEQTPFIEMQGLSFPLVNQP
ncbi:WD domain-containing protein, G-beta repeat-containing protein [Methylomagnum ishizawai]|uniref:WD domain-containing protein, G-beta repeat-containing protein n=1 Tax=Methylomagnum ishizawai TaxID=1760988 RepID=A0A1Y6D7Z4_9GAMM|nr:caspase family protein [Methylomagnum ishizawai]SMF96893.1 WD domain-containing protein, G-beta repeat-containing protein [Methylomagnum ishizawai]